MVGNNLHNSIKLPTYKQVIYSFNPRTRFYTKCANQSLKMPYNALPFELRREFTQAIEIKGKAKECLTQNSFNKASNTRKMLTGLQETAFEGWFTGDHIVFNNGKRIKSLLIVHFTLENRELNIFYFPNYYKDKEGERLHFVHKAIPQLLNEHYINK